MQPTTSQKQRLIKELSVIAAEKIEDIVFTPDWFSVSVVSELAALRIFYYYRNTARGCEFIKEIGRWIIPVKINN